MKSWPANQYQFPKLVPMVAESNTGSRFDEVAHLSTP
jgi:hypothetical protein